MGSLVAKIMEEERLFIKMGHFIKVIGRTLKTWARGVFIISKNARGWFLG